jgi:hypothetical protein
VRLMKKGWCLLAPALVVIATLAAAEPAFAFAFGSPKLNAPKAFQAQFTLTVGPNPPQHGVMYYSHGRIREEITPSAGGAKAVTIIDPISKTIYELENDKKAFKIDPWDPKAALLYEALRREGKYRFVQTQTIAGQECDNFEIHPKAREVKPFFVFVNKSTRYPVLLTTQDPDPSKEVHIEWTNVSPGFQAPILFAPPLGYAQLK